MDSTIDILSWNFGGIGTRRGLNNTRATLEYIAQTQKPTIIFGQEVVNSRFKGKLKNIKLPFYEAIFDETFAESRGLNTVLVTFLGRGF